MSHNIKILLLEDDVRDADLIGEMLKSNIDTPFDLECAARLSEGVKQLVIKDFDVALVDLGLPDSHGLETFKRVYAQASDLPIIVLSGLDDEEIAVEAVRAGAQDYLIKAQINGDLLARAIRYAIERKRVDRKIRRRNRELALLNRAAKAFSSSLDMEQVLTTVLEEVRHLLSAVASSIWLVDPATDELVCRQVTGPGSEVVRGWRLPQDRGLVGWTARHNESLVVPDTHADERHFTGVDQTTGLDLRSILSVPLRAKRGLSEDSAIGVLQIVDTEPDLFTQNDLSLVESLAATAAISIENARLFSTEQQRVAALAKALEQQRELDRLKDEFIQNVSHELRTPLTIARGYAEMLDSGALGELKPKQQKPVSLITRRVQMLSNLVDDINAILDKGAPALEWELVDMADLVRNSLNDFRITADQQGIDLTAKLEPNLSPVSGDPTGLRRVLDNLLGNALKFTPGGGRVDLYLEQEGDSLRLDVADTGIGIPADQLDRVFERFYQVDGGINRRYGGTGLGLALVKEIVETHGGQVEVRSKVGEGSTFTIWLPVEGEPQ